LLICLLCFLQSAHAQDANRAGSTVTLSAFLESLHDENPLRASEEVPLEFEDEFQNSFGIQVGAGLSNDLSALTADYRLSRQYFANRSQENESIYTGQSSLIVGNNSSFYEILASHQVTRRLNVADGVEINRNINEVNTVSVEPQLRTNPNRRTVSKLTGIYTSTDFKDNSQREDTVQEGLELILSHTVPENGAFSLVYTGSKTSFDGDANLDFDYSRLGISYARKAASFQYELSVGRNKIEPDNGDDANSENFYFASIAYAVGQTSFTGAIRSELSATSLLSGIEDANAGTSVQGIGGEEDRVKVKAGEFGVSTRILCDRCNLNVSYSSEEIENTNFTNNDVILDEYGLVLGYQARRSVGVGVSYRKRIAEFINDAARDTTSERYEFSVTNQVSRSISAAFFVSKEKFDAENRRYNSAILGLRFGVTLL